MVQHKIQSMILIAEGRPVFPPVPVQTTATFDSDLNPLLVELQFDWVDGSGVQCVTWEVSRELLVRGNSSRTPYGKGDFRLCYKGPGTNLLEACLRVPEGHAHVGFNHIQFGKFLDAVEEVMPLGSEDLTDAIDQGLKELLK